MRKTINSCLYKILFMKKFTWKLLFEMFLDQNEKPVLRGYNYGDEKNWLMT